MSVALGLLAHLAGGHWLVDIATYLVPFLLVVGLLKWSDWRAARREEAEGRADRDA